MAATKTQHSADSNPFIKQLASSGMHIPSLPLALMAYSLEHSHADVPQIAVYATAHSPPFERISLSQIGPSRLSTS
jgi:hypothetical protein